MPGLRSALAVIAAVVSIVVVHAYTPLVKAGSFSRIYEPSTGGVPWYVNDHTLVYGAGDVWHLYGITHTEPADPEFEVNFAHATSTNLTLNPFQHEPFSMGTIASTGETHLWAPYIFLWDGVYYNYYCGGSDDRTQYQINLATSTDLWTWQRRGTMFTGGVDGRDPVVLNLGPDFNNEFMIVYTGTNPDSVTGSVNHVNYARTSTDLLHWSDAWILFDGGSDGNNFGGPTESPFVLRRGKSFYLANGAWEGQYALTRFWVSANPYNFGSVPLGTAVQCGDVPSHALEVVRGVDDANSNTTSGDGGWYVTHAGWGQGGVWLAPLTWLDELADPTDTSMPIPSPSPTPLPPQFTTTLSDWVSSPSNITDTQFIVTPSGLHGGNAMNNGFTIAQSMFMPMFEPFTYFVDVRLTTANGNPDSTPNNNTRVGSAAGLAFFVGSPEDPSGPAGGYFLNLHTADSISPAGVKLFKFAPNGYERISEVAYPSLAQDGVYRLAVATQSSSTWDVFVDGVKLFSAFDNSFTAGGYFGLYVWQGSAIFQNANVQN